MCGSHLTLKAQDPSKPDSTGPHCDLVWSPIYGIMRKTDRYENI